MQRAAPDFEEQEEGGGALSLDRALSAVRKRKKLIVAAPVAAAILVGCIVWMIPNRYDASAIVQIDPRQKSITNIESVVSDIKADTPSIESEVEIIKSRPIVLKVIETLGLRNDPEFAETSLKSRLFAKLGLTSPEPAAGRTLQRLKDEIADILKLDEPGASRPENDAIADAFIQRLKVTRVRNTLLIEIHFTSSEASKAARIANTVAETYIKDQLDSKVRASTNASDLLEAKIEEMRKKVSDAERKVETWKAEHNVFDSEGQLLSEKQIARLMEQTVTSRATTSEAKAKYLQVQKLARAGDSGTAIVEVLQSNTVRLLKEQLANATRKSAELRTKYGPKHPEILKVDAEKAEAQEQLRAEVERLVANLKNEAEVAEERERQLMQSLTQLKNQQVVSKDSSVELKDLEREAATSKQLFETLLARYKQTSETQGFQLPDVRFIEKANAPQYPASPKRKQLVGLASAGGLVLGIALAVLFDLMQPGISRQDDIERVFDVAHLSSVPTPTANEGILTSAKAVRLVVAEPAGLYADAIRGARRELDMRRTSTAPRIILVTSSIAGEGAELIASNLAHNYAMTGSRPLLIDGDMRLQLLTRQLANQRQAGLLDQLLSRQPLEPAILRDGVTGLNFLPAARPGPMQGSIPETLNSNAMAEALAGLKTRFDTIIIAVPPLLPVIDGRILADYADQIVFVVAWQKTPKQLAKSALKTLGLNSSKLAGVILNDVAPEALNETRGWPRDLLSSGAAGPMRYAA
jgi:polysaccharide biosynthesis transport protein